MRHSSIIQIIICYNPNYAGDQITKDMTNGSISKHLYGYMIPLLLSSLLQMGYNAIDSIIVGRFINKSALSAAGIASPIMNVIILLISGLCIGGCVLISQCFGSKDYKALKLQFTTTLLAGTFISIIVSFISFLSIDDLLYILHVPNSILEITAIYL